MKVVPNQKTLYVRIPMELMDKFKEKSYKKFNYEKGALKKACIEAILDWCKKN